MVVRDAFLDLVPAGVKGVNLEGVNSLRRGYLKLSFGGSLIPRRHLQLRNSG